MENDKLVRLSDAKILFHRGVTERDVASIPAVDAAEVVRKPVKGYEGYYEVDNLARVLFDEWMDDNKCVHVPELNRPHLDTDILEEAGFEL